MKVNRDSKFICHMVVLFVVLMFVSIAIDMRYYARLIIWGLFAYIIVKEIIDHQRAERYRRKQDQNRERLVRVIKKLDKIKQDIQGTV